MDDEQQSMAYAQADFSTSNQLYVDSLVRDFPTHLDAVVDIGCGPADVVIRLAKAAPHARITALDGSGPMIELGRSAARRAVSSTAAVTVVRCCPFEGRAPPPARTARVMERSETPRSSRRCGVCDGSRET